MKDDITIEEILFIVREIESQDPIDWGMLQLDEDIASEMLVNQLVDKYNTEWSKLPHTDQIRILLASMAKLVIENFVLNVKLTQ